MSLEENDPYERSGLVLLLAAMLFLILAFLGGNEPIAPALIVASLGLFLTGILLLTFSRSLSPDPVVASLLPVQHQLNTASLLSRSGCRDPALFIPAPEQAGKVMQFHTLSPDAAGPPRSEAGLARHNREPGILLPPACLPLLKELEGRFHLRIPTDPGRLPQVIREVAEETLEIAARVVATGGTEEIRVDLLQFTLYPGCRAARETSPDVCLRNPCTICSLLACLVVRATGKECRIASVDLDDRSESVYLVISFRPLVPEEPAVQVSEEPVPPVPAEPVFSGPVEPVSLAPEEQAASAMDEPITPFPEELVPPVPEEPVPAGMDGAVSQVQEEPEPMVPEEQVASAMEEPATPIPKEPVSPVMMGEPEVPVWWSRHPGSRRLRYLPEEPAAPVPAAPAAPVAEEPATPPSRKKRKPGSRKKRKSPRP
ncbi:MAG: hypothetical protein LUQ62_04645 [Methanomicrobiales archaeon]|nr:hypothetical protein [Methanomicrobiales archaeon]